MKYRPLFFGDLDRTLVVWGIARDGVVTATGRGDRPRNREVGAMTLECPPVVSRRVTASLLDPLGEQTGTRVTLGFSWSPADPQVVVLSMATVPGWWWVLGVELLESGLQGPAGLGDVSVLPALRDDRWLELILSSPSRRVGFRVSRCVMDSFLRAVRTQACV